MEENVALDTSKQKKFVKSIKGIKKLIKKAEEDVPETVILKEKNDKKSKKKRPDRGLVYLSHIPHGFYEHEMSQYFSQFGQVTNVRVIRSKKTGNSKGFAFVEFKQPEVAEIVAETMNNYLMGKRLIKAAIIPPEKQKLRAKRKHWSQENNPTRTARLKQNKAYNENKDKAGEIAKARRTYASYKKNMKKLSEIGINYDFFAPVDMPKELIEIVNPSETKGNKKETQSKDLKTKKETKQLAPKKGNTEEQKQKSKKEKKAEATPVVPHVEKTKKNPPKGKKAELIVKKAEPKKAKQDINKIKDTASEEKLKGKKTKTPEPVNKTEQKQKQNKLKNAGVKPPENFIKIQEEEESDSDGSDDFNSDDFSNMVENDSDIDSNDESGDDSDEGSEDDDEEGSDDEAEQPSDGESDDFEITGSDDDESDNDSEDDEEIILPEDKGALVRSVQKKMKIPTVVPVQKKQPAAKQAKQTKPLPQLKTNSSKQQQKGKPTVEQRGPSIEQKNKKASQQKGLTTTDLGKRKAPQKIVVSPKKSKFEKQTQQPMKTQFKKKK